MKERGRGRATPLALAVLALLFAVRFHGFLTGGTLYARDAGFFFAPWRGLVPRLLKEGFPAWNEWLSNGRAFAADPNAALFWPLTPLLLVTTPTVLTLANVALLLGLFFLALRSARLSPVAAAAGTAVLLFSGVFQSLPVYAGIPAAAAPLAPAAVVFWAMGEGAGGRGRLAALGGGALALSFLGGEPAITVSGAAACLALAGAALATVRPRPDAREAGARLLGLLGAVLLAAGLSAIQLLPATSELARSARASGMEPRHGALFWSVRPSRLLTLLEPRLTGDPNAEGATFWGTGTFDAGQPYFPDLALGLVPLALALISGWDRRGRAALGLAAAAGLFSFGRFLPGYATLTRPLAIFRYPEKWWVVATLALAFAAAVGVERLLSPQESDRGGAIRALRRVLLAFGALLLLLAALALVSPLALRAALWKTGLGAGSASSEAVAALLASPLAGGAASALIAAGVIWLVERGRAPFSGVLAVLVILFGSDAARRVAGTLPAGPRDLYTRPTPAVELVTKNLGAGRFFDDGADDRATAERRTLEAGGLDPLRPATGVLFGIRYALENDVDRMTSAASVSAAFAAARQPWGEAKLALLREAGVRVVRTSAPPPDPTGVSEIGRSGADRLLSVAGGRPEFHLVREAIVVPGASEGETARSAAGFDPVRSAVIEIPGTLPHRVAAGEGRLEILERSGRSARLRVSCSGPVCALLVGRTFDPNWRVTLDGRAHPLFRADGFLMALFLPPGVHEVELRYENALFGRGLALSALSAVVAAAAAFRRRAA